MGQISLVSGMETGACWRRSMISGMGSWSGSGVSHDVRGSVVDQEADVPRQEVAIVVLIREALMEVRKAGGRVVDAADFVSSDRIRSWLMPMVMGTGRLMMAVLGIFAVSRTSVLLLVLVLLLTVLTIDSSLFFIHDRRWSDGTMSRHICVDNEYGG